MVYYSKGKTLILLLIILGLAVFFRFYQLTEIPPGLYPDVAINGNDAISALKTNDPVKFLTSFGTTGQGFKVFYPENNGREGLFINLIALSFAIFGVSIWAIKIVPAIIGVLTVLGLYLMTKELFENVIARRSPKATNEAISRFGLGRDYLGLRPRNDKLEPSETIALLSAFFLAISFWHVNFSRLGFRAIMVPFFLVWSFYFLFRAARTIRIYHTNDADKKNVHCSLFIIYWMLAGLFFGLGFHTYIAFRVAPLILAPILIIEIIKYWPIFKEKFRVSGFGFRVFKEIYIKDSWWKWDVFFVTIIIVALPIAIYFYQHPQDFIGRAAGVSIFATENPIKELGLSAVKTLGMFNFRGDCNWRHNYACSPQLLWPTGILFIIGFFLSLKEVLKISNYKEKKWTLLTIYWTLVTWFFAMLLPAILTFEGAPHALRSIGVIPVVYVFAGIGGWWIYNKLKFLTLKSELLKESELLKARPVSSGALAFVSGYGSAEARRTEAESEQKRVSERARLSRTNVSRGTGQALIIVCFLFLITLAYTQYDKYFIDWAIQPDVKGAFTQNFVNIGHYLNNLSPTTQKYVIVNESGVAVPYPNGLPMPTQTIMFITETRNQELRTGINYLKSEQVFQSLVPGSQSPTVIVPMKYERNLFRELKKRFPQGEIEANDGFWAFKINFK